MNIIAGLETRSYLFWLAIGLILVVGIGAADFWTGRELGFSLFYLIPVLGVTWFRGRTLGIVVAVASAAMWLTADALAKPSYSRPFVLYWNATIHLVFFVVVTLLLPALKELEREKYIARHDYLTNAVNRRCFFEVVQRELDRSQRYQRPFAIAYVDLDGFKTANDRLGHRVGDQILCAVVNGAKMQLRKTDVVARLGGDEFVLLLPEADQDAARTIVSRTHSSLLDEMQRNNWPVTFSIGVLTCHSAEITADELIKKADELMYSVKRNGCNGVLYAVHAG